MLIPVTRIYRATRREAETLVGEAMIIKVDPVDEHDDVFQDIPRQNLLRIVLTGIEKPDIIYVKGTITGFKRKYRELKENGY